MTSTTDNGNGTVRYFYNTEKRDTKQMHKTNELKHRSAVNTLASHTRALYSCEKHAQPTAGIMNRKFALTEHNTNKNVNLKGTTWNQ